MDVVIKYNGWTVGLLDEDFDGVVAVKDGEVIPLEIESEWYSLDWEYGGLRTPRGILGWDEECPNDYEISGEGLKKAQELFDRWQSTEWVYTQLEKKVKRSSARVEGDGVRNVRTEADTEIFEKGVWSDPSGFFRDFPVTKTEDGMSVVGTLDMPEQTLEDFIRSTRRSEWDKHWQESLEAEWLEANAAIINIALEGKE